MNDIAAPVLSYTIELPSFQDTERYAQHLAPYLSLPLVMTLSGEIGAGKTTFVRALFRALGVQGPIKSPTYSLLETYDLPCNPRLCSSTAYAHHFDLYRLLDDSELEFIGFRDYFQPDTLCCIEWPERTDLPAHLIDLALSLSRSETGRILSLRANPRLAPIIDICMESFKQEYQERELHHARSVDGE